MRLAVHTDFEYHADEHGELRGEHAFTLFFVALAEHCERLVLLGREVPGGGRGRYGLGSRITFAGLPYYPSLWRLRQSAGALLAAPRRFWRALDEVDVVWLLGPHPLQLVFAVVALMRGRRVALGVRQEFRRYVASRHPDRPLLKLTAAALELSWRLLARLSSVVVVGPTLAGQYRHSRRLLEITASLISSDEIEEPAPATAPAEPDELRVLSVGRIEAEKNPLLLADVLALLRADDPRWRMTIIGEGPLEGELRRRFEELGLASEVELAGYVEFGPELMRQYRRADLFLHVSWSEGLPQVLIEAFAAGTPAVATDVGGVRAGTRGCAVLIPPGDAVEAASAVRALWADPERRARLVREAQDLVRGRTVEVESERVARFLAGAE